MGQNGRVSQGSEDSYSLIKLSLLEKKPENAKAGRATTILAALVMALVFSSPSSAKAPTAQAKQNGLHIKQRGAHNNHYDIVVTSDAVRVHNLVTGYTLVSRAPDWEIVLWRDSTKQITHVASDVWCRQKIQMFAFASELRKPIATSNIIRGGDKHILYTFGTTSSVEPYFATPGRTQTKNERNRTEMLCLDFPGCNKTGPILDVLQSFPLLPGIPLSVIRIRPRGVREYGLSTELLEETKVDNTIFRTPKGYTQTKFSVDFVQGETRTENIKSIFEELPSNP